MEDRHKGGDEQKVGVVLGEAVVVLPEDLARRQSCLGILPQHGDSARHQQCRRDTLARNVGDDDANVAVRQRAVVVQIASHILGRQHARVDHGGAVFKMRLFQQTELDLPRNAQLCFLTVERFDLGEVGVDLFRHGVKGA